MTVSSTNQESSSMRHGRRRDGIGQDRLAFDVDAVDDRRLGGGRQVGADALDRVLDVVDGGLRVDLEAELDDGLRGTLGDRRGDVLDAGDVGDRVLDALGDLRLKLARRDAGIGHRHRDDRHVDVGEAGDRQLRKAHQPERQQDDEHQDRRNRVADRPGGKIPAHQLDRSRLLAAHRRDHVAVGDEGAGARHHFVAFAQCRETTST